MLLGAVERLAAMLFHLGASVLVMQVFLQGTPGWMGAELLAHTSLNAAAVYGIRQWGVVPTKSKSSCWQERWLSGVDGRGPGW